jgi:hypothetical protein
MTQQSQPTSQEIPGTLRAIAVGSAIGAVAAMAGVGGALSLAGYDASVALGIGGMAAFWGGLGFGSMLGGTVHLVRNDEAEERARLAGRTAPGVADAEGSARQVNEVPRRTLSMPQARQAH